MRIKPARLLALLAASLTLVTVVCGFPYAYITNDSTGLPLKWPPGTIAMRISAQNNNILSDGSTEATCIQAAMQAWNQNLGDEQFAPPQILALNKSGADRNGINEIFFSDKVYGMAFGSDGTLAITTAWFDGNERTEADTIFNTAYAWDSYRGVLKSNPIDLQRVAIHELGHALGLDHPDENGFSVSSIMNSRISNVDSLQSYDIAAAQFLYGPPGIPANNSFAAAATINLSSNVITLTGYNTNATKETGEPNHADNPGGRSVWWKWTAGTSGMARVTTAGSVFDTTLGIYTGFSVAALTAIASSDDVNPGIVQSSTVTFTAIPGTTYYIAVDGFNNTPNDNYGADSGGIALNFTFSPINTVISETVVSGHGVTFTAAGAAGAVQWQVSTDGGTTWADLNNDSTYSGVTTVNLTIASVSSGMSGFKYRAVVTVNGVSSPAIPGTLTVTSAVFSFPTSIAIDALGNLYVGDSSLDTVQKIIAASTVSPVAGSASLAGAADGIGTAARFNQPSGLSASAAGVLGVSDTANATIRVIQTDGTVTTLAGSPTTHGNVDATGSAAAFSSPIGIARDASGTLYIADAMNHTIRKVTSAGAVTTLAGNPGVAGYNDNTGNVAQFNYPTGIAVDASGNVYVADTTNNLLRKISPAGAVTTLAGVVGVSGSTDGTGSAALFNTPGGLAVDTAGNIYLADTGNSTIRKITPANVVTTLAGLPGIAGFKDGTGINAWFNQPKSLVVDGNGNLYVADTGNATIRRVTPAGLVTTLVINAVAVTTSTTSSTTIPPTGGGTSGGGTSGGGSSGGGGGGAPSGWFFAALSLLAYARRMLPKKG